MKKVTIKLLVGMAGLNASHAPGDEYECGIDEAVRLVEAGSAEPKTKKSFEEARKAYEAKLEEGRKANEVAEAKLKAERIELELDALYREVATKEALLAGVSPDDEAIDKIVEDLKLRESRPKEGAKK